MLMRNITNFVIAYFFESQETVDVWCLIDLLNASATQGYLHILFLSLYDYYIVNNCLLIFNCITVQCINHNVCKRLIGGVANLACSLQWWRQGSPRQGVIVPRQGAEVSAGSTLPWKLPPPYFVALHILWCRGTINKLLAHTQELYSWSRRCSVGPGICVRGRPLPFPYPSPHLAPSFPIFPPLTSRAPLKQLWGLEERCKIPQRSPGRIPGRKRIWCTLNCQKATSSNRFQNFKVHFFFIQN